MNGSCYCILLRKASRRLGAIYDEALSPFGINVGQFSLLRSIGHAQPVSLTQLGQVLELDRSTVGRNAKVLEKMGLVAGESGEDQREALLSLTDEADALLAKATPVWEGVQHEIENRMGEAETAELKRLLRAI